MIAKNHISVSSASAIRLVSESATNVSYANLLAKLAATDNGEEGLKVLKSALNLTLGRFALFGGHTDDSTHGETPKNQGIYLDFGRGGFLYLIHKKFAPQIHAKGHSERPYYILLDRDDEGPFLSGRINPMFQAGADSSKEAFEKFTSMVIKMSNAGTKKEIQAVVDELRGN